jgi:hypothetical protein
MKSVLVLAVLLTIPVAYAANAKPASSSSNDKVVAA